MEIETAKEKEKKLESELENEGIDVGAIKDKKSPNHIKAMESLKRAVESGKLLYRIIPILADGANKELGLDAEQEKSFQESLKNNMAAYDELIVKLPELIIAVLSSKASIEEKRLFLENITHLYEKILSAQSERLELARKPIPRWLKISLAALAALAAGGSAYAAMTQLQKDEGAEGN